MSMSPFSYLCVSLLLASNGSPLLGLPSLAVSRSSSSSRRRLRSCTLIISEFSSSCCRPGLPLLSLLSICHPSLLDPYPWIHDAQNDIGQQCADDCHEPVEQDQDVRHTEVTCRYGIQEQPAHARVAVDHFYKDRAAEQCHDFITEESCNRKYGISEYMPAVYRRLLHTFGPGQDDEILLFRFNDAAPEILYRAHQADQRDGETRQHQMIDLAEYKVEGPRFYAGAD